MRFYTDVTTKASKNCLLNVRKYQDPRKKEKKNILIDPGVYDLVKAPEYSQIALLRKLAEPGQLASNEFISIDYPCDMNPAFSDLFVKKSVDNNFLNVKNDRYICTVQFKFMDFDDFKLRFAELAPIWQANKNKPIAIGNMCRLNEYRDAKVRMFTRHVFEHVLANLDAGRWLHVYGMPLWMIIKWVPRLEKRFTISVDSTKWTRAVDHKFKATHGVCARGHNRDEFFLAYMARLRKEGIKVDY